MKTLTGSGIWQTIFVPALHRKFLETTANADKIEAFIQDQGGFIFLDHGATRTPYPEVYDLLTRMAKAFGLSVNEHYSFPSKKLTAIDLQQPGLGGFKWFSSLIDMSAFPDDMQKLVAEDKERAPCVLQGEPKELLKALETDGYLEIEQAEILVDTLLRTFFTRSGKPMLKRTFEAVSQASSELLNALLLGPDFNHIAYDLNALKINHWYGLEVIEIFAEHLELQDISMLPAIQGAPGGLLRQTSTKAEMQSYILMDSALNEVQEEAPGRFLEFIQRGPNRDEAGKLIFKNGKVALYQGFLSANTEKIYEATRFKQ